MIIHVGGDEVALIGTCPECKKLFSEVGRMGIYLEYFIYINGLLKSHGRKMGVWGDQILIFQPGSKFWVDKEIETKFFEQNKKLFDHIRDNTIIYDWWYEGGSPESIAFLKENRLQFVSCSSTNGCYTAGITLSQQKSQRSLYKDALSSGAYGILTCDWMNYIGYHAELGGLNLASGALFSWSGTDRFDTDESFERFRRIYALYRYGTEAIVDYLHMTSDYNSELLALFPQKFRGNALRKSVFFSDNPLDIFMRFDVFFSDGKLAAYKRAIDKLEKLWDKASSETDDPWFYLQKMPLLVHQQIYRRYVAFDAFYREYDKAANMQFDDTAGFRRAIGRCKRILKAHRDNDYAEIIDYAEEICNKLGMDYASVLRLKKTRDNLNKLIRFLTHMTQSDRSLPYVGMLSSYLFTRIESPFWYPRSYEWAKEQPPFVSYEVDDRSLAMCYDFDYDKLNPLK